MPLTKGNDNGKVTNITLFFFKKWYAVIKLTKIANCPLGAVVMKTKHRRIKRIGLWGAPVGSTMAALGSDQHTILKGCKHASFEFHKGVIT